MKALLVVVGFLALLALGPGVGSGVGPAVGAEPDDVRIAPGTGFEPAQVDEIRSLVDESKVPVRVLALKTLPQAAAGSSDLHAQNLATKAAGTARADAVVLVFSPDSLPEHGAFDPSIRGDVAPALRALRMGEAPAQEKFVELVRMVTTLTGVEGLDRAITENFDPDKVPGGKQRRVEDEPDKSVVTVRWIVLLGLLALLIAIAAFRGRALVGWLKRRRRTDALEGAALGASHKNLADQAKADVATFGAAIDAEGMEGRDVLDLWKLALDDYDKASTLLDNRRGPMDDRRIIGACKRGMERLGKAQR